MVGKLHTTILVVRKHVRGQLSLTDFTVNKFGYFEIAFAQVTIIKKIYSKRFITNPPQSPTHSRLNTLAGPRLLYSSALGAGRPRKIDTTRLVETSRGSLHLGRRLGVPSY